MLEILLDKLFDPLFDTRPQNKKDPGTSNWPRSFSV